MEQDGQKLTPVYKKLKFCSSTKILFLCLYYQTNQPTNQSKADLKVKQTNKKKNIENLERKDRSGILSLYPLLYSDSNF